jgi:hypothetical protein
MRRMLSLAVISAGMLAVLLSSVGAWVVSAHPGPHVPSPPSHDYDTVIPGIQGRPTSPVLANPSGLDRVALGGRMSARAARASSCSTARTRSKQMEGI